MTMDREQESLVSRRSVLTAVASTVVGVGGAFGSASAAIMPAAAGLGGDTILIDAWVKYQAAQAYNAALSEKTHPMFEAALASLPPHMDVEEYQCLSEDKQEAYQEQRRQDWKYNFDRIGVTAMQKEQQHFIDTVLNPLAETIRNTAPTTLEGVAIKAAYLLKYEGPDILETDRPQDLDWDEQGLRQFIEQLANLPLSGTGRFSGRA